MQLVPFGPGNMHAVQPFESTAEALSSLREQDHQIDLFLIEVHAGEASSGSTALPSFDLVDLIVDQTDIPVISNQLTNNKHQYYCTKMKWHRFVY